MSGDGVATEYIDSVTLTREPRLAEESATAVEEQNDIHRLYNEDTGGTIAQVDVTTDLSEGGDVTGDRYMVEWNTGYTFDEFVEQLYANNYLPAPEKTASLETYEDVQEGYPSREGSAQTMLEVAQDPDTDVTSFRLGDASDDEQIRWITGDDTGESATFRAIIAGTQIGGFEDLYQDFGNTTQTEGVLYRLDVLLDDY